MGAGMVICGYSKELTVRLKFSQVWDRLLSSQYSICVMQNTTQWLRVGKRNLKLIKPNYRNLSLDKTYGLKNHSSNKKKDISTSGSTNLLVFKFYKPFKTPDTLKNKSTISIYTAHIYLSECL